MKVKDLEVSRRTTNGLTLAGFLTLEQVAGKVFEKITPQQLAKILKGEFPARYMGSKGYKELQATLQHAYAQKAFASVVDEYGGDPNVLSGGETGGDGGSGGVVAEGATGTTAETTGGETGQGEGKKT